MKNVVGQTPRGDDFYQRPKLIDKFYRRLDSGSHLYMAAPRRVGKTSIMRFLQDNPRQGYEFVYVFVEAIDDPEEFFQVLLNKVLKSEVLSSSTLSSEKSKNIVKEILDRIKSVNILGSGFELNDGEKVSFREEFEKLLTRLEPQGKKIIIMIDEFPQVVENINQKYDDETATKFLRVNRSLRQSANVGIQFIYTGSIGLPIVVKKFSSLSVINDLNQIEVPPLTEEQAIDFSRKILDNYKIRFDEDVISHLIARTEWLIPHFLQLAIQEMIDIFENTGKPISKQNVDDSINQLINLRNNHYFESYHKRLENRFSSKEYKFALKILSFLAQNGPLEKSEANKMAQKSRVPEKGSRVLESLEFDGYISQQVKHYRFTSPILKMWWAKYVSN